MTKQGFLISSFIALFFTLLFHSPLTAQSISINEVMASNSNSITDENGDNEDWIELYNYGSTSINLTGYGLSDNYDLPFKWVFPSVSIGPGQFLLVWASVKNRATPGQPLHTNFSISAEGEEIILTASDGTLIDELPPTPIPTDYSYGRLPNGTGNWFYYTQTTPNSPNSSNTTVLPPDPPVFSTTSGFYTQGFTLILSHPNPEAVIIYTTDGSAPTSDNLSGTSYNYKNQYPQDPGQSFGPLLVNTYTSNEYSTPLIISDRSIVSNKLANISSTWHFAPNYIPSGSIKKANVIRAVALVGGVSSTIATHTYFVSATSDFNSSLPIASITLNEDDLFDYDNGIYVAGKDFDNWRQNNPTGITNGHRPANYRREGVGTEKSASFQYFVDGNEVLNQNIGLRLHGSFSRHPQNKTFRLYARSEYDPQSSFEYPFFGSANSSSFKRILLRNSGNDVGNEWIGGAFVWTISPAVYFRDAFIHKMVSHLRFDTQDYVPVITYVNGEYWGILNLRERYDSHYLERKYGIQEDDLEYLTGNASVTYGRNAHYLMTRNFISNNNLADNNNYNYVKTLIDTDNFMDYQISQIYARNTDWPGNNIDYFRKRTDQYMPDAPYGQDGRWRWLMFDTDHGFGWSGGNSYTHNTLQGASNDNSWAKVILFKLLGNQNFRNDFINRYADLLNTTFLPERLVNMINEFADRIASEIPIHRERWNTLHNWETHVELMCEFAEKRPSYARSHIISRFSLSGQLTATLNVSDVDHGYLHINTTEISEKTVGVSANPYPWTGIYFRNIPISITAVPKPGYKFSHWSGASTSHEATVTLTPNGNFSLQANFVPIQEDDFDLIYFWLMDNRMVNNTPLESLSSTYSTVETPATITFYSSYGAEYPFVSGHPNWRKGSMERRNAPTPLNYYPFANYNLEFGSFEMRGMQVKQPFLSNNFENTLIFNLSTLNYKNILFSFAAIDEGAANKLIIDYFDPNIEGWVNTNLFNSTPDLTSNFQQYNFDFSNVSIADNNAEFKIRLRFAGTDMTKDEGNRVTFNNFSIKGIRVIPSNIHTESSDKRKLLSIFPVPSSNQVHIQTDASLTGMAYKIHDLYGNVVISGIIEESDAVVDMSTFTSGIYVLMLDNDASYSFKIVKK